MKRWIRAIVVFSAILLIAWVGGLDFERGGSQAFALFSALVLAWCAYILSID